MTANTVTELKEFFSTPEKKCSTAEFMDFWKALSDEEKDYYKTAALS